MSVPCPLLFASPPLFHQLVIRKNVIRHVDNASDPSGAGISVSGCTDLIVEDNVLDLEHATPIAFSYCDKASFFNNRTSAGTLIRGVDTIASAKASELTTDIEDAMLIAF